MGGGEHFPYPKGVWSPMGGWWNENVKNWQRNTTIAFAGIGAVAASIYFLTLPKKRVFYWGPTEEVVEYGSGHHTSNKPSSKADAHH